MLHEEFLQAIKDSGYGHENYCIYKFTFGKFGEYVGKVENRTLYLRYKLVIKKYSSKKVQKAVESCSILDFKVEILYRNQNVSDLREKEIVLISQLDPKLKLNTHKGGDVLDNKIIRKFQNLITGEIVEKSCSELAQYLGLKKCTRFSDLFTGKAMTAKNWCLPENYEKLKNEGKGLSFGTNKKYKFKRLSDGQEEYLSVTEMSKKYKGISLNGLINKRQETSHGWCLPENYDRLKLEGRGLGQRKSKRYKFKRLTDNFEEYLGAAEMSLKYGGHRNYYSAVANKKRKSTKNWILSEL